MHIVTEYATKVVYGDIKACKYEILACKRHLEDLELSKNEDYKYIFDETRADRIYAWFNVCNHVRGPFSNTPINLDNWQKFDLGCIFGWVEKETGKRKYKTAYNRVARGNAKSTQMSAIVLFGMCADALYIPGKIELAKYEQSPEVVVGAVDREQANIVWGDAREMAIASKEIFKRLNINKSTISNKARAGKIKKLSKDTKNKDGGSPCMIIIDEYHAHPTSLIKDVTSSGKGKRSQCLEFIITTAGEDAENSPCYKEDIICKKILEKEIPNESYFVMIREIDDEDDPHDINCWIKANPMLQLDNDYSKNLFNQIKDEYEIAFGSGDSNKIRQWMIKRVNRFQAGSQNKYFSNCMDAWKENAISRSEFIKITRNKECYVGVDLSKSIDLTAIGFVFRLENDKYAVCSHGFLPEESLKLHKHSDRVPYDYWEENGNWVSITSGNVTDDRKVKGYMHDMELDNGWSVKEFCYDPYSARQLTNELSDEGYICVEIRQSFTALSEATKSFRELVMQGKIIHDGSPLLQWCLSNAVELQNEGELIRLSKKHKDDSQRIDAIACIINAFVRALLSIDNCPYDNDRGILML